MNLDGTRPNPGKTRVYLQKSRFTRKIPGRVPTNVCRAHDAISPSPRASALLAARNACSSTRTVPCAAAMRALRRLRRSGGRGMPMAVRTMRLRCVLLQDRGGAWHALLRSQSAHRNEAAQQAGCCQQGPMLDLPHARIVQRGPAYTGFSDMRLFELEAICENYLARCRRSALKKQQRESEEEDAEAAIAEHEKDRSPAAGEENLGVAPYRLYVDHGGSLLAPGRPRPT